MVCGIRSHVEMCERAKSVTLGAWRRPLALLELVRLYILFAEDVLMIAVSKRLRKVGDIGRAQS